MSEKITILKEYLYYNPNALYKVLNTHLKWDIIDIFKNESYAHFNTINELYDIVSKQYQVGQWSTIPTVVFTSINLLIILWGYTCVKQANNVLNNSEAFEQQFLFTQRNRPDITVKDIAYMAMGTLKFFGKLFGYQGLFVNIYSSYDKFFIDLSSQLAGKPTFNDTFLHLVSDYMLSEIYQNNVSEVFVDFLLKLLGLM
jgi:hypothetical protein